MENLKDRIQLLISTKGMTNATFAEKIGVQPSNISHVLSGRNKPSLDLVHKILISFKEVRTEWLVHGSGSMTKDYNLFEMEGEEIPQEKISEVENSRPVAETKAVAGKIAPPFEAKTREKDVEKPEIKAIKEDEEVIGEMSRKIEKENPHKKHHKSIERIVVFYGDRTFKEYYPES